MASVAEAIPATPVIDPQIGSNETLRSSLAQVINALDGGSRTADSIGQERVSERQLYFALVYAKAKEMNPTLANELLTEVPRLREALRDKRAGNPLPKAIEAVLNRAIREKQLNRADVSELKAYALGRAQLDAERGHLAGRKTSLINRFDERVAGTSMDAVADRVTTNPTASRKELRSLNSDLKSGPTLLLKRAATQSGTTEPPAPAPTAAAPQVTTRPQVNPETFEWIPNADDPRCFNICAPLGYTGKVRSIMVRDEASGEFLGAAEQLPDDAYGRTTWKCSGFPEQTGPVTVWLVGNENEPLIGFGVPSIDKPTQNVE